MTDSKISDIQGIVSEVDTLLRERLKTLGVNIAHVILAIASDGAGVLRSNVGEDELGDLAELLGEIAEGSALRPHNAPP